VTPAERERIRAAAVAANDADHAAGLLPSRYVEDEGVLAKVARLILASAQRTDRPNTGSAQPTHADGAPSPRRRPTAAAAAPRERATGAGTG
jgi:hypothetical protein